MSEIIAVSETENTDNLIKEPVISVAMLVYNHAEYLDHALQSIFSQNIKVPFEVVVGEDCSPDASRQILNKWKQKYPANIRLIYREHNVGMNENTLSVLFGCRGKYVAWLEGDDYWTDNCKLQKQYDFLENHKEYIAVLHNVQVVNQEEQPFEEAQNNYPLLKTQDFTMTDWKNGKTPGQTASFFYRNIFKDMPSNNREIMSKYSLNGDSLMLGCLFMNGKVKVLDDVMAAYRYVTQGGHNWNSMSQGKNYCEKYYQQILDFEKLLAELYGCDISLQGQRYRQLLSARLTAKRSKKEEDRQIASVIWEKERNKFGFYTFLCKYGVKRVFQKIFH